MIYRFLDFELDDSLFELRQAGEVQKVEPQVFSLLWLLVANSGRVVTKDEINIHVWDRRAVSDAAVDSRIRAARQAIGDDGRTQNLIKTLRGRGFRFLARVSSDSSNELIETGEATAASVSSLRRDPLDRQPDQQGDNRPSIAVLPLQLLTPDERFGRLGDAVSQEVIIELCRLHWLHVIARGSSFRLRDSDVDVPEFGRLLGVRYLMTGTISFYGNTSVVTAELLHVTDGRVVWAERFKIPVDDLLELRLTISSRIVAAVEAKIQMNEASNASLLSTENLDAWSAYHRGLWHMYRFNSRDVGIAASMFERAIEADKQFARAYAGLSYTHFHNVFQHYTDDIEHHRKLAREYAEKSMALDPMDPFINLAMGRTEWLHGNVDAGLTWVNQSIELSPNYAYGLYNQGILNSILCNGEQGDASAAKALSLSPIDPTQQSMMCIRSLSCFVKGDNKSALFWADRAVRAPNNHPYVYAACAIVYDNLGRQSAAKHCVESIRLINGTFGHREFLERFSFSKAEMHENACSTLVNLGL